MLKKSENTHESRPKSKSKIPQAPFCPPPAVFCIRTAGPLHCLQARPLSLSCLLPFALSLHALILPEIRFTLHASRNTLHEIRNMKPAPINLTYLIVGLPERLGVSPLIVGLPIIARGAFPPQAAAAIAAVLGVSENYCRVADAVLTGRAHFLAHHVVAARMGQQHTLGLAEFSGRRDSRRCGARATGIAVLRGVGEQALRVHFGRSLTLTAHCKAALPTPIGVNP